jgi:hypothetical protein
MNENEYAFWHGICYNKLYEVIIIENYKLYIFIIDIFIDEPIREWQI